MALDLGTYTARLLQDDLVLSVLVLNNQTMTGLPYSADHMFLVILNTAELQCEIRNVATDHESIVELKISRWQLESWAIQGVGEQMAVFIANSEIIMDKEDYIKTYRERLKRFTAKWTKRKICREYSGVLRHYLNAKELFQRQLTLDAYQAVLNALQGWARIAIYQAGELPGTSIWMQVKQIDPSVYKLYEELVASHEPFEKRVELLLLPVEFSVMSQMKTCTQLIIDIMQTENRPWFITELLQHPDLSKEDIDICLLLEKMAKRSLVAEVKVTKEEGHLYEKGYLLTCGSV